MTLVLSKTVGEITVTEKTGAITSSKETLGLTIKEGPTAEIGCELFFTKNLGNYQSAKLGVSIRAPSNIDPDSLDKTFIYLNQWCDEKLTSMIADINKDLK